MKNKEATSTASKPFSLPIKITTVAVTIAALGACTTPAPPPPPPPPPPPAAVV